MSNDMIQLLVLAGIAVFLVLRLRNVLGTREGFEKPPVAMPEANDRAKQNRQNFEVIDEMDDIEPFLSEDVRDAFKGVIDERLEKGLSVEANFVGVRELVLHDASFDEETSEADVTVKFVGELTSIVRDSAGDIVEGDPNAIKRQKDVWTFSRKMGSNDPNWQLVATGG